MNDELARLMAMDCECETSGYCWPCREIVRLRAELWARGEAV